jgi:hypothetical protein
LLTSIRDPMGKFRCTNRVRCLGTARPLRDELVDRLTEAEALLGPDGLHRGDHVAVE